MKKWKRGLKRLTAVALAVMMVGTTVDFSAFAVSAAEGVSIECTCGTDDPAFHATNCPAYIAPENPQCYCAEKCTEDTLNVWCDVCGVQGVSACQGTDTAVAYEIVANGTCGAEGNESSVTWSLDSNGTLTISGSGAMWDYSTANVGSKKRAPWYEHKDNITAVIIEEGVTTIGTYAFWMCAQLTEITISATVTTIGNSAFMLCESLIQITIPQSVTSIGEFAFSGCSSLTSVTLPNSISTIQQNTFANCTSLTSITIPNGVTTIGPCAFCDCTSLNSITIPEGVTTIGDMAFYGCTSLGTIVIPSSVTTIGANVFNEVPGVSSEDGFLIINGILMKYTGDAANVEIPSGVTKINQRAFEDNQSIVTVKIPSGVTTLGSNAFFNCDSLVSVELPETLISMESSFIYCDGLKEITIPNGMETIGRSAFYECKSLEKVTIPNSVTEIGDDAFKNIANSATINAPCSWNENPLYTFADGITVNIPAHQNMTYSVNDEGNVINNECSNCGKVGGTLTINAEGGIYDGTTKYGATVEKTGTLENAEVTVNYYQGDNSIGTDAPVDAGTYTAKITYEDVPASCQFEIAKATPTADMFTYTSSAVYDGTAKSANVVVKDGITGIGQITNIKYYQNDIEVTPVNAGTYTVKIDVAEGDLYAAATDIEVGTFEITKATPPALTIPTATTITYGEKLSASTLSDSSWAWVDGTIVPNASAYYNAYIEVDDSNYDYTDDDGYDDVNHRVVRGVDVTITRATLTITANSYTIKVGSALPTYKYTVTGLVNGDTLPFNVSLSCSATDSNAVGTYPITISGVVSDTQLASRYVPIYVNGTLTITEKDIQEITADDITLTYGDADATISVTGAKTGLTYEVISDSNDNGDVVTVDANGKVSIENAGTAIIKITAVASDDYAESECKIRVTVNKRPVNVPAKDSTVYTYTGKEQTYRLASSPYYTIENATHTNVGKYEVSVTLNDNCIWNGDLPIYEFEIKPARPSGSGSSSTTTNPPSTQKPSTEEPSTEEPSTEEPSTEDSSTEDSSTEEPDTSEEDTVEWKTDENGTFYEKEDGTKVIGWYEMAEDVWYYFDENGYRQTGWEKDGENWYYLNENGVMQTGWQKDGEFWYYLGVNGTMKTGWLKDGETWYYLGVNGAMKTGWQKDGEFWYYLGVNGAMKTGWVKDGETWYYLSESGAMKTGWVKDGETWYYLSESGAMKTGWIQVGADWFYLNSNGSMAANTYIGKWYVDKNGYYIPSKTK